MTSNSRAINVASHERSGSHRAAILWEWRPRVVHAVR